jgi:hypothetical protein
MKWTIFDNGFDRLIVTGRSSPDDYFDRTPLFVLLVTNLSTRGQLNAHSETRGKGLTSKSSAEPIADHPSNLSDPCF